MEHGFPDILNDHISSLGLPRPILEKLHAAYDWENAPAIIKLVMEGMDNEVLMFHYHLSKRQIDKVDEALKPHGLSIQRLSSE